MKLTEDMIKELKRLDINLWKHYKPDDTTEYEIPDDYRTLIYIKDDIETIMMNTPPEQWNHYITDILSESPIYTQLLNVLELNKIKEIVKIRKNWATALKNVKKGTELSSKIEWRFSDKDLIELATLHKKNKYRRKIEDLLEDCNFHHECGMLNEQKYEELFQELKKPEK